MRSPWRSRAIPNFLAGPYLDRRSTEREDPDWLANARQDPETRYVLARGTAHLIETEPLPRIQFVSNRHPAAESATDTNALLLGWYQERRCVLIETSADHVADAQLLANVKFEELRPLTQLLDGHEAALLAYARALSHWRSRHRFCGNCGAAAQPVRAGHVMRCSNAQCANEAFPRIDPAIIVLVTDGERALLGRQASWPEGRYSTIAGFVEPGESLEDAVAREVHEETGVRVLTSSYHSSQPWPFPSSLMLGFQAVASGNDIIRCNDAELADARWFTREEISSGTPKLPPATSISLRLIQHWFDSGSDRPLSSYADVGRWDNRPPR